MLHILYIYCNIETINEFYIVYSKLREQEDVHQEANHQGEEDPRVLRLDADAEGRVFQNSEEVHRRSQIRRHHWEDRTRQAALETGQVPQQLRRG